MTNLSTVISHVTVDEYRLQELSTEVALASRVDYDYEDDYEDVIAVNDDGDEIDFPPPGTVSHSTVLLLIVIFIYYLCGYIFTCSMRALVLGLHVGSEVEQTDPIHILAWQLNQALLVPYIFQG